MLRLTNRRNVGPSFSVKKTVKIVKVKKKTADVRPLMPFAIPCTSVAPLVETPFETSLSSPEVPFAPASLSQPVTLLSASEAAASICADCSTRPPTTSAKMRIPSASRPSRTTAAPAARGHLWAWSRVTIGAATAATTPPATTGSTIVEVIESSQVAPTRTRATPTRNHASSPRSRSQCGAEKTRESEVASISTTVRVGPSWM